MKQARATRRRRCRNCNKIFRSDPRLKGNQHYCFSPDCQSVRQRLNEKDWRERNPDCVQYQHELTRDWYKAHPQYSRQRREKDPQLKDLNRDQTRDRMREMRQKRMFDKSKSILQQLSAGQIDRCYLGGRFRWLHVRLTKASRFSRIASLWKNAPRSLVRVNRLPRGRLYEFSEEIFDRARSGP